MTLMRVYDDQVHAAMNATRFNAERRGLRECRSLDVEIVEDETPALLQHGSTIGKPDRDPASGLLGAVVRAAHAHGLPSHDVQAWLITEADVEKKRPIGPWDDPRGFGGQQ